MLSNEVIHGANWDDIYIVSILVSKKFHTFTDRSTFNQKEGVGSFTHWTGGFILQLTAPNADGAWLGNILWRYRALAVP